MNWRFQTSYTNSTSLIRQFIDGIRRSLDLAGFDTRTVKEPLDEMVVLLSNMSNKPREIMRDSRQPDKYRSVLAPLFETGEITQKFKDFVFAENIRLQRLSLCKLGLQTRLEKFGEETDLSEICSVPLP